MTTNDDIAALGYEAARDQLAEVVRALEAGNVPLESALQLWERGEALAAHCQHLLDGARRRLDEAPSARVPHPAGTMPHTPEEETR